MTYRYAYRYDYHIQTCSWHRTPIRHIQLQRVCKSVRLEKTEESRREKLGPDEQKSKLIGCWFLKDLSRKSNSGRGRPPPPVDQLRRTLSCLEPCTVYEVYVYG